MSSLLFAAACYVKTYCEVGIWNILPPPTNVILRSNLLLWPQWVVLDSLVWGPMVCLLWFLNHLSSHVPLKRSEISHKEVAPSTRWSSIQLLVNSFGSKSLNPAMRYKCILIRQYSTLAWFNRTVQSIHHRFLFVIEKLEVSTFMLTQFSREHYPQPFLTLLACLKGLPRGHAWCLYTH